MKDLEPPNMTFRLVNMVTNFTNCNLDNLDLIVDIRYRNENTSTYGGQIQNCSIGSFTFVNVRGIKFDNCSKMRSGSKKTALHFARSSAIIRGLDFKDAVGNTVILLREGSQIEMTASRFKNNQLSGGLIKVDDYSNIASKSQVEQNATLCLDARDVSKVSISNSMFEDNSADVGSVIHAITSCMIQIQDCSFFRNRADTMGGAIYAVNSSLTINLSTFESCQGTEGAAIYVKSCSTVSIQSSTFKYNEATNGTIYVDDFDEFMMTNTSMERNRATGVGSCVYASTSVHSNGRDNAYTTHQTNETQLSKTSAPDIIVESTEIGIVNTGPSFDDQLDGQMVPYPSIQITDSLFKNNNAWNGTIYTGKSTKMVLLNVTLDRNKARFEGGKGGLLIDSYSKINITHSHFLDRPQYQRGQSAK